MAQERAKGNPQKEKLLLIAEANREGTFRTLRPQDIVVEIRIHGLARTVGHHSTADADKSDRGKNYDDGATDPIVYWDKNSSDKDPASSAHADGA